METRPHLVEPLSIDEAFLDLTGTQRALGDPIAVAKQSEDCIRWELGVTASVGVASCKLLAKLASDMNKLDGLTVIREEDIDHMLPPLPMTKLWGIGLATAAKLEPLGIRTFGDLRGCRPLPSSRSIMRWICSKQPSPPPPRRSTS